LVVDVSLEHRILVPVGTAEQHTSKKFFMDQFNGPHALGNQWEWWWWKLSWPPQAL
jgi:hypothetical protein